jgi:hypothetical protein
MLFVRWMWRAFFILSLLLIEGAQCREREERVLEKFGRDWRDGAAWGGYQFRGDGWEEKVMFCGEQVLEGQILGNRTIAMRNGEGRALKNDCSMETCNVCRDCW